MKININMDKKIESCFQEAEKYLQEKEYMKAYFKFNDVIAISSASRLKGYCSEAVFGMYRCLYEYAKSMNKWNYLSTIIFRYAMQTTSNKQKREEYTEIYNKNLNDFYDKGIM